MFQVWRRSELKQTQNVRKHAKSGTGSRAMFKRGIAQHLGMLKCGVGGCLDEEWAMTRLVHVSIAWNKLQRRGHTVAWEDLTLKHWDA